MLAKSRPIRLLMCVTGLLNLASCGDRSSVSPSAPTQVRQGVRPFVPRVGTPVSWVFLAAMPVGDCFADRLNRKEVTSWPEYRILVTRSGSDIRVQFNPDLEDDVGYVPGFYSGTVHEDGSVQLTHEPWVGPFVDPFRGGQNPMCYSQYTLAAGTLRGAYGPDGIALSGVIEDTFQVLDDDFQVVPGRTFTVKSSFKTK